MNLEIKTGVIRDCNKAKVVWENKAGWPKTDTSARATSDDLMPVLRGKDLYREVALLEKKFGRVYGLDLMGHGSRLAELGIGGVAVSLGFNPEKMRDVDRSGITLLSSDITMPRTWDLLSDSLYHIVLWTPGSGGIYAWGRFQNPIDKFTEYAGNALSVLCTGGILLFDTTTETAAKGYLSDKRYLEHGIGMHITYAQNNNEKPVGLFRIERLHEDKIIEEPVQL